MQINFHYDITPSPNRIVLISFIVTSIIVEPKELVLSGPWNIEISLNIGDKIYHGEKCILPTRDYYIEQVYRHKAINVIQNCILLKKINDLSFKTHLTDMITEMQQSSNGNQYVQNIITDLSGQVMEALNMTSQG